MFVIGAGSYHDKSCELSQGNYMHTVQSTSLLQIVERFLVSFALSFAIYSIFMFTRVCFTQVHIIGKVLGYVFFAIVIVFIIDHNHHCHPTYHSLSLRWSHTDVFTRHDYHYMFNQHANVQHIDLKAPLFGRGGISEDLKSMLITIRCSTSQFCSSPLPIFILSLQVP